MPRKKRVLKRQEIGKDFMYGDVIIARLMNQLMWSGKKALATSIVYCALDAVKEAKKEDPLAVFKKALENIKPVMEVRSRRIGGANYQVPIEVRPTRKLSLGLKWLIEAARKRGEKTFAKRLANEILEALENKGNAVKKKEETHRMAEANRAFAHYRW